ncbi:unnamed protein product [Trifolium pratense]|uniref:Uncharacterized protein n=1 Tax=Trifolium pratense TaxID=57577 RepID=A0ACB0JL77_TRIPR|nr:unnamed protein product [Trifolium pratense]
MVVCGLHNHVLNKELEGQLVVGRLKPGEKEVLAEMTRNLVSPKNIISTSKERNPNNVSNIKQVYTVRHRLKLAARGPITRSEMQQLLKCLKDNNYVFKVRTVGGSIIIQDIFFSHPKSVNLFNSFPNVLLMDATYKTNGYNMPLFEIVGVMSTEKTFGVGFAFLSNEKEDNYTWP